MYIVVTHPSPFVPTSSPFVPTGFSLQIRIFDQVILRAFALGSDLDLSMSPRMQEDKPSSLAERLHGLTGRIQHGLTHHRSSEAPEPSQRMRTGSLGASVHPMFTVTTPAVAERSSDSSPSHSQVSRNSSRKSNNSLLVNPAGAGESVLRC